MRKFEALPVVRARSLVCAPLSTRWTVMLLMAGGLVGSGCSETPTEPERRSITPTSPERRSITPASKAAPLGLSATASCGQFDVVPDPGTDGPPGQTIGVGGTQRYKAYLYSCADFSWHNVNADWVASNPSVASLTEGGYTVFGTAYVEARGLAEGWTEVRGTLPGDPSSTDAGILNVVVYPLATNFTGPTNVTASSDCNLVYSAGATGGAGGYSYFWETSGTIKQNYGTDVVAAFPTAGQHWIQVTVTDAAGAQAQGGLLVNASLEGGECAP